MRTVAYDLSGTVGWAVKDGADTHSGTHKLYSKRANTSETFVAFHGMLIHDMGAAGSAIVCELPTRSPRDSIASRMVTHGLFAIARLFAAQNGIVFAAVNPGVIKRFAPGKGNAIKDQMHFAARKRWPERDVRTHHEADALWLLAYWLQIEDQEVEVSVDILENAGSSRG